MGGPLVVAEAPCLRRGITNDAYHRGPGLGASQIKELDRSAAHYEAVYGPGHEPTESSDDMLLGAAADALVDGGPAAFIARFQVAPELNLRKPSHRAALAEMRAETAEAGRELVTQVQATHAWRMADSALSHPLARALLEGAERQVSLYWRDAYAGVLGRARPDALNLGVEVCADLKTTDDARERAFRRILERLQYPIQAAWYLDGVAAVFAGICLRWAWIVVERTPPYAVQVYLAHPEYLRRARVDIRLALDRLVTAQASGVWASYPHETVEIAPLGRF